jgi:hypothetical protein
MTLSPATRVMINQFLRECIDTTTACGCPRTSYCSSDEFSPDNSKSRTRQQGEKSSPNLLVWSLRAPTAAQPGFRLETGGFDQEELGETELAATTFFVLWKTNLAPEIRPVRIGRRLQHLGGSEQIDRGRIYLEGSTFSRAKPQTRPGARGQGLP